METTYSQASQDLFVTHVLPDKQGGHFLEIGASDPILYSNTYLVEKGRGWTGIMVEYDPAYLNGYLEHRKNSVHVIQDARTVDYAKLLEPFPKNMEYLQIDLDVDNRSTLDVLEILNRTVFDQYKFATVTFEHDIYRGDYFNTRAASREIFKSRGYVLVFPNVTWCDKNTPFEDWYVHPDFVDMTRVNRIITDETLTYLEVREVMKKDVKKFGY